MFDDTVDDKCLDIEQGNCSGDLEVYQSLTCYITRCAHHADLAEQRRLNINRRYPVMAPADFDPDYAGERWDDDY